jgi:hypothetical protein
MATPSVFPASLQVPQTLTLVSGERRLMSDRMTQVRGIQRDRTWTEQVTFRPFNAAQAAVFDAWWRDDLIEGGAWFSAQWPHPTQGGTFAIGHGFGEDYLTTVRRFIGPPQWSFLGKDLWRVTATFEVRGTSEAPLIYPVGPPAVCGWLLSATDNPPNAFVLSSDSHTATIDGETFGRYAVEGGARKSSGRLYFEVVVNERHPDDTNWGGVGLATNLADGQADPGLVYYLDGVVLFGEAYPAYPSLSSGDVVGFAVDFESSLESVSIWTSLNGTWLDGGRVLNEFDEYVWTGQGDPAGNVNPTVIDFAGEHFPFAFRTFQYQFGVTLNESIGMQYEPPEGFTAWNPECLEDAPVQRFLDTFTGDVGPLTGHAPDIAPDGFAYFNNNEAPNTTLQLNGDGHTVPVLVGFDTAGTASSAASDPAFSLTMAAPFRVKVIGRPSLTLNNSVVSVRISDADNGYIDLSLQKATGDNWFVAVEMLSNAEDGGYFYDSTSNTSSSEEHVIEFYVEATQATMTVDGVAGTPMELGGIPVNAFAEIRYLVDFDDPSDVSYLSRVEISPG